MISNQKLQNALNEMKEITKRDMALFNMKGKLMAHTTDVDKAMEQIVSEFGTSMAETQSYREFQFYKVVVEGEVEYIYMLRGNDEAAFVIGQMAVCQIRNLVISMEEQFDRNNFIQNVLLGNMLTVDIYTRARKMHIEPAARVVYVIDTGKKGNDVAIEMVKNLSDLKSGDFVTCLDEHSIILIKDIKHISEEKREEELKNIADSLVDSLHMEAMIKVRVGYGNVVEQIPEIAASYQEAKLALEVGRVFYAEYDTISYGKLGIGRLIYQLPMSLCNMFIKEVFGDEVPEILDDEEAMSTINRFFENNLNISETARQLYVHRNTLVYRLERIEKAIGLDIRTFEDAMTFRIAVMVLAHMKNQGQD